MKLLFLFFALAFAAMAQISGITLSGNVSDPVLVNHAGKTVIAALVVLMDGNRHPWVSYCMFTTHTTLGVSDGGSAKACGIKKAQKLDSPIVSATINAVIFSDGEFRGHDSYEGEGITTMANFQSNTEMHMQSMRQIWQMAKDGNWAGVKAVADKNLMEVDSIHGWSIAQDLVSLQSKQGSDKAASSLAFLGLLPTTTWKGTLINKQLRMPDIFQAIADWISPRAERRSLPPSALWHNRKFPGSARAHASRRGADRYQCLEGAARRTRRLDPQCRRRPDDYRPA